MRLAWWKRSCQPCLEATVFRCQSWRIGDWNIGKFAKTWKTWSSHITKITKTKNFDCWRLRGLCYSSRKIVTHPHRSNNSFYRGWVEDRGYFRVTCQHSTSSKVSQSWGKTTSSRHLLKRMGIGLCHLFRKSGEWCERLTLKTNSRKTSMMTNMTEIYSKR